MRADIIEVIVHGVVYRIEGPVLRDGLRATVTAIVDGQVIARRIAEVYPDLVLAAVEDEEARLREGAISGDATGNPWQDARAAEYYAGRLRERQPVFDLARRWCGRENCERYDEVKALRAEVARLSTLVEDGARLLEEAGRRHDARRILKQLRVKNA